MQQVHNSRLSVIEMNMDNMVEKKEVIYKRYCPDYPNSESDIEGMYSLMAAKFQ